MSLFECQQLSHQLLGRGRSESELVPQFFSNTMTVGAPVNDNPCLKITPGYVNHIFADTNDVDGNKFTVLRPQFSAEIFHSLSDSVFIGPDAPINTTDVFEVADEDISDSKVGFARSDSLSRTLQCVSVGIFSPKPPKKRRRHSVCKVTIEGTSSKDISVVDVYLNVGSESVELPKGLAISFGSLPALISMHKTY